MRAITVVILGTHLGSIPSGAASPAVMLDPILDGDVQSGAVCSGPGIRCTAHVRATSSGRVIAYAAPQGLGPSDLQSAYNIDTSIVSSPTVAIFDAYGYPTLEQDLGVFRSTFGLPPCTVANGCLRILNESGQTSPLPAPPPSTEDWTIETAMDIETVSAACPACKIVVVQAQTTGTLMSSVSIAGQIGADVVSLSWGAPELPTQPVTANEPMFVHPGITIFAASGDWGYNSAQLTPNQGPFYPSTSANVIAVGGTTLKRAANARGWTETVWSLAGSSCSLSIPRPAYQTYSGCAYKATADIAAVADLQTGLAIFNNGSWLIAGGTSVAAPLVAAIFATTGNSTAGTGAFVAANASKLYDVTSGSNGACTNLILCNARVGWDGPTGYGTPNGRALAGEPDSGSDSAADSGSGMSGAMQDTGGCAAGGGGAGLGIGMLILALRILTVPRGSRSRASTWKRSRTA